jgi:hypothetical protein
MQHVPTRRLLCSYSQKWQLAIYGNLLLLPPLPVVSPFLHPILEA